MYKLVKKDGYMVATFGGRLRRLREEKDLKQTDLAKLLKLESSSTISQYENEALNRIPDAHILQKLAELFNVSIDYLLGRTDIRNESASIEKVKSAISDDPELLQFWEELIQRDDLKVLMRQVRDLPPDGIKRLIRYIKMVEDEEAAEEI